MSVSKVKQPPLYPCDTGEVEYVLHECRNVIELLRAVDLSGPDCGERNSETFRSGRRVILTWLRDALGYAEELHEHERHARPPVKVQP
ncbi:MAG: hypothetical protein LBE59_02090 [Nevskiaceae bacterium]|jgi:hypothetical protein|nr:hypothetical protein [Nevskiaceae bacterium]